MSTDHNTINVLTTDNDSSIGILRSTLRKLYSSEYKESGVIFMSRSKDGVQHIEPAITISRNTDPVPYSEGSRVEMEYCPSGPHHLIHSLGDPNYGNTTCVKVLVAMHQIMVDEQYHHYVYHEHNNSVEVIYSRPPTNLKLTIYRDRLSNVHSTDIVNSQLSSVDYKEINTALDAHVDYLTSLSPYVNKALVTNKATNKVVVSSLLKYSHIVITNYQHTVSIDTENKLNPSYRIIADYISQYVYDVYPKPIIDIDVLLPAIAILDRYSIKMARLGHKTYSLRRIGNRIDVAYVGAVFGYVLSIYIDKLNIDDLLTYTYR